jgi:hypothetical protein
LNFHFSDFTKKKPIAIPTRPCRGARYKLELLIISIKESEIKGIIKIIRNKIVR